MLYSKFHPFNILKYCPYCGAKSFAPCNEKALQCNNCKQRLYINMAAATVGIIENDKKELLVVTRKNEPAKGTLDLPGGFVDLNEIAEHAIAREIKEELNLEITQLQFCSSFPNEYLFGGIVYFTLDLVFRCSVSSFNTIRASDDAENFIFLPPQKINIDDFGLGSIKKIIQQYKVGKI